ncbi:MAG: S41 family peptidase [Paludibacteraceae bacterium]|nr:S41 family peptidase [Paludibacteraceae bacterium]
MKRLTLIFLAFCLSLTLFAESETPRVDKHLRIYYDIMRELDMYYTDTLPYEQMLEVGVTAMLKRVDPYTVYFPKQKQQDVRMMTTGKYGGIGAIIQQFGDSVCVSNPYKGMPAQKAGLRAGDIILCIDSTDTKGLKTDGVSKLLRGNPGSKIHLEVLRENEKLSFDFEREDITLSPVSYSALLPDSSGYICFSEFTERSAGVFAHALDSLNGLGMKRIVIDLRGNGGGLIDEAVKIMSLFVDRGTPIVTVKGRRTKDHTYRTASNPKYKNLPVIVLVDNQTASAAEIVSGAMQDLDRGIIVGTRTYGKGLVQNIRPIAFDGQLKLTTAKYYIPSGRCIQAIDYSKRRQDGSVERVPDSLTHTFKTRLGRTVRDGGGIVPDLVVEDDTTKKINITYDLYRKQMYFRYANHYRNTHPTVPPMKQMTITDAIFNDFVSFLEKVGYKYETETSRYYKPLFDMANREDLDSATIASVEALKAALEPDFHNAVYRQRELIEKDLLSEIATRYYFNDGLFYFNLQSDEVLLKALKLQSVNKK